MSSISVNTITDASGGSTTSINGFTPSVSNMAGRNRIINGDMRIDQRNAGAAVTPTDGQFSVDRWAARLGQASKYSIQQNAGSVTPPSGFVNYLGVTSLSSYSLIASDYFAIQQGVEGFNLADLGWGTANAKTVTLSFWVRSSLTGTFGGCFQNRLSNRSYPFSYTISSANTWEQKSVTVAGDTTGTWDTNNVGGVYLFFALGMGSNREGTANAWNSGNYLGVPGATSVVGTNGATFYITGVQLEEGSVATPFCPAGGGSYGAELALCRRYYAGSDGYMTLHPLTADGTGGYLRSQVYFDTTMRAAPTITLIDSVNIDGTQSITTNKVGFYADGKSNSTFCYSNSGFTRSAEL